MPRVPEPADSEAFRPVLLRLALLDAEVQAVTQTVLEELPALEAGPAQQTLSDIGDALVDAFSTLADSLEETHRLAGGRVRPRDIDLTVVRPLDRVAW
jgi:hypothetical protein